MLVVLGSGGVEVGWGRGDGTYAEHDWCDDDKEVLDDEV